MSCSYEAAILDPCNHSPQVVLAMVATPYREMTPVWRHPLISNCLRHVRVCNPLSSFSRLASPCILNILRLQGSLCSSNKTSQSLHLITMMTNNRCLITPLGDKLDKFW
ncbi:unnamed protein product, partial [Vitis vinifera]